MRRLIAGTWGDTICSLGQLQYVAAKSDVLYYGTNRHIFDLVKCQKFVADCQALFITNTDQFYQRVKSIIANDDQAEQYLSNLAGEANIKESLVSCLIDRRLSNLLRTDIPIAHNLSIPHYAEEYAQNLVQMIDGPFILVQPFSINTNPLRNHWHAWGHFLNWLKTQDLTVVLVGQGWDNGINVGSKWINLVDRLPTMNHTLALVKYAAGVITTSNSLAHWCATTATPTICVCTNLNSEPHEYFHKVLRGDNMFVYNSFVGLEEITNKTLSLFR